MVAAKPISKAYLLDAISCGKSKKDMALELGIAHSTVYKYFHQYGIETPLNISLMDDCEVPPKFKRPQFNVGDRYGTRIISDANIKWQSYTRGKNDRTNYIPFVLTKCDCSEEYYARYHTLKKRPRCIRCARRNGQHKSEYFTSRYISGIIQGARDRKLEYAITTAYIDQVFRSQNFRCNLSNVRLTACKFLRDMSESDASIDRIDSSIGYIVDNIQILHKDLNQMKMDWSQDRLIEWCRLVTNKERRDVRKNREET